MVRRLRLAAYGYEEMKSLAFVTPKIDTFSNPTLIALIEELQRRDIRIIFFGFEQIFIPSQIRKHLELNELPFNFYEFEPSARRIKKLAFQYADIYYKLKCKHGTECIFCVDPMGLVVAGRMKNLLNAKIIYASFEIFFEDEFVDQRKKVLKRLENVYSEDVDTVVIQDPRREALLREVNNFRNGTRFVHIPVAPVPIDVTADKVDVHRLLRIPREKRIAVYSGSLLGWSGINEMLDQFPDNWDNDFWFLIHSHHRLENIDPVKKKIDELISEGMQITLHDWPFYEYKEYASFLAGCDVGFATYFPNPMDIFAGKNIQVIGLSSGKLSTYMMLGLPSVVTNHMTYAELMQGYEFGSIIYSAKDIRNALKRINENYDRFSSNCLRLYNEILDPTQKILRLADMIENEC